MRRLAIALAAAATLAALLGPAFAAQAPPAPTKGGRPLRIAAAAADSRGNPVEDLRPNEFEVWVGIFQVPIETVTVVTPQSERGRVIVLLLDDITVEPSIMPRVKEVARRFVTNMKPDDQMVVAGLNGTMTKSTDDRAVLLRRIDQYNPFTRGVIPFDRLGEHVLRSLTAMARQLTELPGRKIFVGIGSGWLFDTPIPPPSIGYDLRREWVAAIRALASADASLYIIDPGGLRGAPFTTSGREGFARETGGHAFLSTNDITGAADRILQETATYYELQISDPPTGKNAELRELDVRVLRKDVTLRARRWIAGGKPIRN